MNTAARWWFVALLFLSACGPAASQAAPTATPTPAHTPVTAMMATLLPSESPPTGATLEFRTDFSVHTVPYSEILSGGPPKDGITAIDHPRFVSVSDADAWLKPVEPVIFVQSGG